MTGGGQVPKSAFGCVGKKTNLLFFTMSPAPRLTQQAQAGNQILII